MTLVPFSHSHDNVGFPCALYRHCFKRQKARKCELFWEYAFCLSRFIPLRNTCRIFSGGEVGGTLSTAQSSKKKEKTGLAHVL